MITAVTVFAIAAGFVMAGAYLVTRALIEAVGLLRDGHRASGVDLRRLLTRVGLPALGFFVVALAYRLAFPSVP